MKTAPPQTKPGTKKLSEVARKVVAPSGIVATGWPAVRDTCTQKLGITFDPWQDGAGRLILAKRADGKLAVMIGGVGLSVPRQVGKTYLIAAITFALCILRPGLLVIWSAHHARTHGETFLSLQALADRAKVKPHIRQVFVGSGDEEIRFRNGSRILFGARERGFGRGIPGVDVIVSDEAQIMTEKALDAQLATMNTSQFGLAIYVGTPPRPEDPSEAFTRMRSEAWAGTLTDAVWIELGADPGAEPGDRRQWARANPSFPHRTPVESMLRLQRKLTPDSFLREGLGIWGEMSDKLAIDPARWRALADEASWAEDPVAFGVDTTPDSAWTSIATAGRGPDGRTHLELVDHRPGTAWVVDRLVELRDKWSPCATVIDPAGPAGAFIKELMDRGFKLKPDPGESQLEVLSVRDAAQACGALANAVRDDKLRHLGEPELTSAIVAAKKRSVSDAWLWDRKNSGAIISPLVAVTHAMHGFAVYGGSDYDILDSFPG